MHGASIVFHSFCPIRAASQNISLSSHNEHVCLASVAHWAIILSWFSKRLLRNSFPFHCSPGFSWLPVYTLFLPYAQLFLKSSLRVGCLFSAFTHLTLSRVQAINHDENQDSTFFTFFPCVSFPCAALPLKFVGALHVEEIPNDTKQSESSKPIIHFFTSKGKNTRTQGKR